MSDTDTDIAALRERLTRLDSGQAALAEEQRLHVAALDAHSELLTTLEKQLYRVEEIARLAFDTTKVHSAKIDELHLRLDLAVAPTTRPHAADLHELRAEVARLTRERDAFSRGQDALQRRLDEIGASYDNLLARCERDTAEAIAAHVESHARRWHEECRIQGHTRRGSDAGQRASALSDAAASIRGDSWKEQAK